jgi:hypothetical protein
MARSHLKIDLRAPFRKLMTKPRRKMMARRRRRVERRPRRARAMKR